MAESSAWKHDAEGDYIEMIAGEKKPYALDWAEELGVDAISSVVWTLDANVTKVTQAEVSPVGQIWLHASGLPGVWPCSAKMTSVGGIVDIAPFRVVIT